MLGYIVRVRFSKSQKVSVALGESLLPFLLFGLLVKSLEVSPEAEDHDDGQHAGCDTDTVGVSVSWTPSLGPHVWADDITQLTERANECDNNSSL